MLKYYWFENKHMEQNNIERKQYFKKSLRASKLTRMSK